MINRTYQTELRRVFLIHDLPEPLTRSSSHLQIFDNYIENTRLRLRSIRAPETKEWSYILEQRFPLEDLAAWKVSEIYLNESEHAVFEQFEGRQIRKNERVESNEIRKNRYFHEFDGRQIEFDVFLGSLWGLNLAKVVFDDIEELQNFEIPRFSIREITDNPFFTGRNLVGKSFDDVRKEFEKLTEEAVNL